MVLVCIAMTAVCRAVRSKLHSRFHETTLNRVLEALKVVCCKMHAIVHCQNNEMLFSLQLIIPETQLYSSPDMLKLADATLTLNFEFQFVRTVTHASGTGITTLCLQS